MPTVHARLSPSASHIWMTCPAAIPLAEKLKIKDSGPSIYADRGTAMHGVMEMCLTDAKKPADFVGLKIEVQPGVTVTIDMEMAELVNHAVKYVNSLDADLFFCEEKVEVNSEHGVFGTVDVIAVQEDLLEIVDLKTGRGEVPAFRNPQLMIYAIGAYREFGQALGITRFRVTIVQPVVFDAPQSYDFDLEELLAFEKTVIDAIIRTQTHKDTFVPSEKACKWCRARFVCPAQQQMMNDLAAVDFATVDAKTPEDNLAEMYSKVSMVKETIKAIETEVFRRLMAGTKVTGYRLAPGSTTRAWDPDKLKKLERKLSALFDSDIFLTEPAIKSPAQLESALKKQDTAFDFGDFLLKKDPPPNVVHETSKKPMWSSAASARSDFDMYKSSSDE